MSSFSGKMREYPLISIDRFDGRNLESSVYFLSHNHADHTVGLASSAFQYRMSSNSDFKLYCSIITRDLLLLNDKYMSLKDSIVALEVNEPHTIPVPDPQTGQENDKLMVTLLPAKHCPGSVMFLFDGSEGTVLYTGDFRLSRKDLSNMIHLHSGSVPKEIRSVYVDTTFCVPQAMYIPERDKSLQAIIGIIEEWILLSESHVVTIKHKALLGYENLLKNLSLHFNMKIHVHPDKFRMYQRIGDMTGYVTQDPKHTQIHACKSKWERGCCSLSECCMPEGCRDVKLRTIAVSTMCFVQRVGLETYAKRFSEDFFRVCYSFHPSYCEVRDLILYLQPQRAFANVIPDGETIDTIQQRLDHFVELAKQSLQKSFSSEYKPIGKLKVKKRKLNNQKLSQQSSEVLDIEFGDIGESPIKCKRNRTETTLTADNGTKMSSSDLDGHPQRAGSDVVGDDGIKMNVSDQQQEHDAKSRNNDNSETSSDTRDESNNKIDSDDGEDIILHLSLSQDDSKAMENFTPKLQDSYGSVLSYFSDSDSDDDSVTNKTRPSERSKVNECEIIKGQMSGLMPNGDIKSSSDSDQSARGATWSGKASDEGMKCSEDGSSIQGSSNEDDQVMSDSSNSVHCSNSESTFGDEPTNEPTKGSGICKQASVHSSDVILLEDDEHGAKSNPNVTSQKKTDVKNDQQLSVMMENDATAACLQQGKHSDGNVIKENGKNVPEGLVTCMIDLTEVDEDDDVYPSTSTHPPRWYGFHGENVFSQFSHPAVQRNLLAVDSDDDLEYCEKEVACSDDECECGGKAKGGTHKYMVPRAKKLDKQFMPFQINWLIDSEGSGDDSLLELPAHVRTRKWIESQSLYMQRRHYLNSQLASSSEVIVIDSDDDECEQNSSALDKTETKQASEDSEELADNAKNKCGESGQAEKDNYSGKNGSDRMTGERLADKNEEAGVDDVDKKHQYEREVRETMNREKDSASVDLSLTSCPTNLSVLAQASDQSPKCANVNNISELRKTVNGESVEHLDDSVPALHRQSRLGDREPSS